MPLTDTSFNNIKPATKVQKLSDGGRLIPARHDHWRQALADGLYRFAGKQKTLS